METTVEILNWIPDPKGCKLGTFDIKVNTSELSYQIRRGLPFFAKDNKRWYSSHKLYRAGKWVESAEDFPPLSEQTQKKILRCMEEYLTDPQYQSLDKTSL